MVVLGDYKRTLNDLLRKAGSWAAAVNHMRVSDAIRAAVYEHGAGWTKLRLMSLATKDSDKKRGIVLAVRVGSTVAIGIGRASQESHYSPGSAWRTELFPWNKRVGGEDIAVGTTEPMREWARRQKHDRIRLNSRMAIAFAQELMPDLWDQGGLSRDKDQDQDPEADQASG